jgi:hypothetical protein
VLADALGFYYLVSLNEDFKFTGTLRERPTLGPALKSQCLPAGFLLLLPQEMA